MNSTTRLLLMVCNEFAFAFIAKHRLDFVYSLQIDNSHGFTGVPQRYKEMSIFRYLG